MLALRVLVSLFVFPREPLEAGSCSFDGSRGDCLAELVGEEV